tara:strand:+ start:274 stop:516 length:243 start_codon:yes stop_codon:yes gene_type:complete
MSETFTWLNKADGTAKDPGFTEPSITPSLNGDNGDGGIKGNKRKYGHNPIPLLAAAVPALIKGAAMTAGSIGASKLLSKK